MQKFPTTVFSVGCAFLIIVLIGNWIILPLSVSNLVASGIHLRNGSAVWEEWQNPEQNTFIKVYVFNVTNPNEIESGGEPSVEEIGPYFYMEKRVKTIIQANIGNDTIRYSEAVTYYFNEELSNGTEDDLLTTLNIPYLAVAQQLSTFSTVTRWLATTYMAQFKSEVFVQQTVKEYLFAGKYQPMIHEIENLSGQEILPNSTFGIFYGKNGTGLGEIEAYAGVNDASRIGKIISWDRMTEVDYWSSEHCNMMNGSDGALFPPFQTKGSTLYIYNPDLCRSVYLKYNKDVEIMGIPGYQFTPPKEFADASHPDNQCFCTEVNRDRCPKNGAYQLKSCRKGAPLIISFPHFFNGDIEYSKKFGLAPNENLHECQINVEPLTGTPILIHKRIQLNADVKRLSHVRKFKNIQDMVFPLLWFEETYIIKEENAALLRGKIISPLGVIQILKWFAIGCSIILICLSIFIYVIRVRRKPAFV